MFIISKYIAECSLYCKHKRVEQLLLNRSKLVSNRIVPTNEEHRLENPEPEPEPDLNVSLSLSILYKEEVSLNLTLHKEYFYCINDSIINFNSNNKQNCD